MHTRYKHLNVLIESFVVLGLLLSASTVSSKDKNETIEATAMGTGTQLGGNIGVTLNIYEFSTPQNRQVLVQAYEKGQNQGWRLQAQWAMTARI